VPLSDNTACAAFTSTPELPIRSPTLLLQMFLRFQHRNMQQDPVDLYRILLIKLSPTSKALYLGLAKFGITVQALSCSL
jgi:hypothetical protein